MWNYLTMLLDFIYCYFVEDFCIYIHKNIGLSFLVMSLCGFSVKVMLVT